MVHAGEKPWTEVRSPHFRVLTDGSANEGRRVAREFEQMRAVFAVAFPKMRFETAAPLTIVAPRDDFSMKALTPAQPHQFKVLEHRENFPGAADKYNAPAANAKN
jgi:hypothetical protein